MPDASAKYFHLKAAEAKEGWRGNGSLSIGALTEANLHLQTAGKSLRINLLWGRGGRRREM